jgi:extradiol dioxygenase family protein
MSARFHLAIAVGNLMNAIDFYCNKLGCKRGNSDSNIRMHGVT